LQLQPEEGAFEFEFECAGAGCWLARLYTVQNTSMTDVLSCFWAFFVTRGIQKHEKTSGLSSQITAHVAFFLSAFPSLGCLLFCTKKIAVFLGVS
jgi:hypothetical protein